ncbi:MAG: transposase [Cyanobacteria bacterium J06626_4]
MRMGVTLDEKVQSTLKDAAKKLTGSKKRAFMAKATEDYFEGSARKAETYLGWKRQAVQLGLHERRTGRVCFDNYSARGAKKTEDKLPRLAADIHELLAEQCHADPQLKTPFRYTKVTAAAVLEALVTDKGYAASDLPCRQTMGSILNRLGYRLKKPKK